MKRIGAVVALLAAVLTAGVPALAKEFVQDQAAMLSPDTVAQLNQHIGNFNAQTGKEIVVQTVPSVTGGDVQTAARNAFAQQQVNGFLLFIDKGDRRDYLVADAAAVNAGWWSSQSSTDVLNAMQAQFRAGDFDGGVTTAVNSILDMYRSHVGSLQQRQQLPAYGRQSYPAQQSQGVHISVFWWIIIALIAYFIIRSIARAASGPRYYGGGGPGPGPGYGSGPGYGGYGPGYGGGWGGGGGFFSGLLGGLGGAWLGNELFRGGGGGWGGGGGAIDPNAGGGPPADAGGWQSDPGQAGMGGSAGGDWGGGGFGGGDFGGGGGGFGGGDFGGGGGGDAGGGW